MPARVHTLRLGPLDNNTYVVACESTHQAAVIDVGFDPEAVIELVGAEKLSVRWLLCTHAHYDHAAGMLAVQRAVGGDFALHPADRPLLEALAVQGQMFGFPHAEPPAIAHDLADREIVRFGEVEMEVLFTPGHAPGHCAFRMGDTVFVGDVLFRGSVGRTDLPGSSFEALERSIREQLFTLDDGVRCLSGHGPATTIGHERRHNPFVGQGAGRG
jgi:glyoxylase-like metal-dependent hydrolase (beta-lactamase superfamily II)